MGCCSGIGRFLLFALNISTFLIGLAFIIVGVVYLVGVAELTDKLDEISSLFEVIPILLIVVGCIVFLISFFGCCGAWRRNSCMLLTYATILIIILLLQIALAIYAFVKVNNPEDWQTELSQALREVFNTGGDPVDFIQETLQCCGFVETPATIPASCCPSGEVGCTNPFQEVCDIAFRDFVSDSMNIIAIVAISLAAIEFIGSIIAVCVARKRDEWV
ncbi:Tetraspanin family [Popillia japonica]|uniref:Tetraspanin n=1 Tax=Popillia japonica TaxID=7064 RepID=A0AAW1LWA5_POPJA